MVARTTNFDVGTDVVGACDLQDCSCSRLKCPSMVTLTPLNNEATESKKKRKEKKRTSLFGFKKTTAIEIVSTTNLFYLKVLSLGDNFTAAGIIAVLNVNTRGRISLSRSTLKGEA